MRKFKTHIYMHKNCHRKKTYSVSTAWWCWVESILWISACRPCTRIQRFSNRPGWEKLWRRLGQSQRKWGFREFERSKNSKSWGMKVNWERTLFPRIYVKETKRLEGLGPLDLVGNDPTVQIDDPRHHKWWPTSEWAFTLWPKGHLWYGWDIPRWLRAHPVHRALSSRCVREQCVARRVPSPRWRHQGGKTFAQIRGILKKVSIIQK